MCISMYRRCIIGCLSDVSTFSHQFGSVGIKLGLVYRWLEMNGLQRVISPRGVRGIGRGRGGRIGFVWQVLWSGQVCFG